MYKIKEDINLEVLRKYGFKLGKEYPESERCICNDYERDDYWFISMSLDEPDKVNYASDEFDQPTWSVHIQSNRRLWIECVPSCTYHIDNLDMEQMFFTLMNMILDGIIEDDFENKKISLEF